MLELNKQKTILSRVNYCYCTNSHSTYATSLIIICIENTKLFPSIILSPVVESLSKRHLMSILICQGRILDGQLNGRNVVGLRSSSRQEGSFVCNATITRVLWPQWCPWRWTLLMYVMGLHFLDICKHTDETYEGSTLHAPINLKAIDRGIASGGLTMELDKSMLIHRWRCDASHALEVTHQCCLQCQALLEVTIIYLLND